MRRTTSILFAVILAMLMRPLQLPAASCIVSNARSADGCKPHCCANKTCCALSQKGSAPVAPPLVQTSDSGGQLLIGFVCSPVVSSMGENVFAQPARTALPVRSHSPPLLATTCIRLI